MVCNSQGGVMDVKSMSSFFSRHALLFVRLAYLVTAWVNPCFEARAN